MYGVPNNDQVCWKRISKPYGPPPSARAAICEAADLDIWHVIGRDVHLDQPQA